MKRNTRLRTTVSAVCVAVGALVGASTADAQVTVSLPNSTQTTTLTATVAEQASITVPAGVAFTVNNVSASTASSAVTVSASGIVLSSALRQVKVSLQANAATFTPPSGTATWNASDVTWNAATWTNATGAAGTLSNSAFNTVATCTADTASCDTSALAFTLAANSNIVRSGAYTLVVTWRFEAIGT